MSYPAQTCLAHLFILFRGVDQPVPQLFFTMRQLLLLSQPMMQMACPPKGGLGLPHSYQLKREILEIYVLSSVRSDMFIA